MVWLLVLIALMQAATLGVVIAIVRSHETAHVRLHERLRHPLFTHGPVK